MDENEMGNSQEGTDLLTQGMGEGNPGDGAGAGQGDTAGQGSEKVEIPKYHDQFADDLKGNKSLTKFGDITALGRGYLDLEGKMGKMVSIPGEDASEEDLMAFRTKLGVPESADKYDLSLKDGIPKYLKESMMESEESLRKRLHAAGVSQTAAKSIHEWMQDELEIGDKALTALQKNRFEKGAAQLKENWAGSYDENVNVMTRGLRAYADKETLADIQAAGLNNSPGFCEMMRKVGLSVKEDDFIGGGKEIEDDWDPANHTLTFGK